MKESLAVRARNLVLWGAVVTALVLSLGLNTGLNAQVVGANLSGTITDPSGAVVPNAQVAIKNSATGVVRTVTSNADGVYSAPNMQPGDYEVTVAAAGFSATTTTITLTVGADQALNLTMKVGQATQTVEVTGAAPAINLVNSALGAVNNETTVKELPLNGRSWSDLADLQPGVYSLHTQPDVQSRDRFTRGYGAQLSISGNRPQQNNYRVDGISINDPANGGPGSVLGGNLGVDAVAEFSVLTTNYSTEYGRASGGIINATIKSGTNQFHGDVYEFLRNDNLDAANFWDNASGNHIPEFKRNQFGVSAGGPIQKDKTFIFGDYEGLRQTLGLTINSPTPTVAERNGILPGGQVITVDPKVAPYLSTFFPLPNAGPCSGNFNGCFAFGGAQATPENYWVIRADHVISDKDSIHGTFFRDTSDTSRPDEFNNKVVSTASNNLMAMIEETHSFSSTMVNSFRIGYHRAFQGGPAGAVAVNPATSDMSFGAIPGFDAPTVQFGGAIVFSGGLTSQTPQLNHFNTMQYYDDAFWTKGKHSIKFGGGFERDQLNVTRSPRPGGTFTFGSEVNFLTNHPNGISADLPGFITPRQTRQSIFGFYVQDDYRYRPNLTLNIGLRYEPTSVPTDAQGQIATLVNQTDEFPLCGSVVTVDGQTACAGKLDTLFHNNTLKDFSPRVGFAWDPTRTGKMSVRGGFGIYDQLPLIAFMGSTVAQTWPYLQSGNGGLINNPGSFGPYSSFPGGVGSAFSLIGNNPDSKRVAWIEQHPGRAYVMQWNFSIQRELTPSLTALIGYVGSHGVHGPTQTDDTDIVLPTATSAGYAWPCGPLNNGLATGNINDCSQYGTGNKINPHVGRLPTTLFRNSSVYHGLQLQLTKRMSHGFQIQGSFAWQKSIDTQSGAVISDSVVTAISSLFTFDHRLTRGVSDFNVGRVFSLNYLWNLPKPNVSGFAGGFLSGWQLGGIFSASDGDPFTPLLAGDPYGLNSSDAFGYPDRLTGPGCASAINPGNIANYVKLQCFQIPPVVTVNGVNYIRGGNVGRNVLRGPGLASLDFSLVKNTYVRRISETFNIQFRAEAFNILNRANFNPPAAGSGNFVLFDSTTLAQGIIAAPGPTGPCTSGASGNSGPSGCIPGTGALSGADETSTTSRQLQFAIKIIW
jgi:Carboxypeptidase regulatory-like domain/TonB dependent receptor-like, beta-barrel/TonB-dependent Receptor Plug Domain